MEIEILGILASLFVLACFLFDNPKSIRILDMIGASLYVIYGILIGSISNIFLNAALVVIQIIKLRKLYKNNKEDKQYEDCDQ